MDAIEVKEQPMRDVTKVDKASREIRFDEDVEALITSCGGDQRKAIRVLMFEVRRWHSYAEKLKRDRSAGYVYGSSH